MNKQIKNYCNHKLFGIFKTECDECRDKRLLRKMKSQLCDEYHVTRYSYKLQEDLEMYFPQLPYWMIEELTKRSRYEIELGKRDFYCKKFKIDSDYEHTRWNNHLKMKLDAYATKKYSNKYWQNLIFNVLIETFVTELRREEIPVLNIKHLHNSWKNYKFEFQENISPYNYYIKGYDWDINPIKYEGRRKSLHL